MGCRDGRRVALVTGAAQGVGRAAALRLAADGFAVAINDVVDDGRIADLARHLDGVAVCADIAAEGAARKIVCAVAQQLGTIDVLVANAAAMTMGSFLEQSQAVWWRQIEVNLCGHFRLVQAVVPDMQRIGAGRIIVVASGWGVSGHPNATAYAASKAGLIALTKGLGRELAPMGILANAIAPAYIDTDQLRVDAADAGVSLSEIRQRYRDLVPIGQLASVDDIAAAVSFLASEGAGAFVGQVLQPSGGVIRARA